MERHKWFGILTWVAITFRVSGVGYVRVPQKSVDPIHVSCLHFLENSVKTLLDTRGNHVGLTVATREKTI